MSYVEPTPIEDTPNPSLSLSDKLLAYNQAYQNRVTDGLYWAGFLILSLLLIAPLWTVTYLPFGDLPDHAAQLKTLMEFSHYADDYRINWFTPYWVGYGLALFFSLVFPVVTALKIVLSLALLAYPLASAWLIRELKGNRFWVWSAFPCAWGFTFYWGFLSYTVAAPIAIAFFAFSVRYAKAELSWRYLLSAALFSIFLFFAHALAWAFSLTIACSLLFCYNSFEHTKLKSWGFLAAVPVVLLWLSVTGDSNQHVESGHLVEHLISRVREIWIQFNNEFYKLARENGHWGRTKELLSFSIGKPALPDYSLLGLLCLLWPKLIGARFSRNWRRYLPLLITVAAFQLVPYWIFDTAYVYYRFSIFLIPLGYCLFEQREVSSDEQPIPLRVQLKALAYQLGGFLIFANILLSVHSLLSSFRDNDEQFKEILSAMEPDKRVMMMVFNGDSAMSFSPAYSHFAKYYQSEKMGEVLPSFAHDHNADNVPVRYRHRFWQAPSVWNPSEFNWQRHGGDRYDYFLVRAEHTRNGLFQQAGSAVVLLKKSGPWHLYGKKVYASRLIDGRAPQGNPDQRVAAKH